MSIEIEIESWNAFTRIADHLDIGDPMRTAYAFRGQADASWELEPTLLRWLRQFRLSSEEALVVERDCLNEFKSQAHLHISPNILSTTPDTMSWWTLMQHHGAPTRLLDWCGSMYVAAYFTVTGHPESAGAVWLVHTHTVESVMEEKFEGARVPKREAEIQSHFLKPDSSRALFFVGRLSKTDRMVAQQGLFSVCCNILGNHGEILRDTMPEQSKKELFRKFVIPARLKSEFLRKLRSMNIAANTLFPGLDGLGRSVAELVQAIGGRLRTSESERA